MTDYALIDSGNGRKLERFGEILVDRPSGQAAWKPRLPDKVWQRAHGRFVREGGNEWVKQQMPDEWETTLDGLRLVTHPTDFGHLGLFPEHLHAWRWMVDAIERSKRPLNVLNLFAYTGAATLAAARAGAEVCHLDAARKINDWARDNAKLNGLDAKPIRWIADDVIKFLRRETRRDRRYDGFILDPPNYGRGPKGEVFKIELDLREVLQLCRQLMTPKPRFVILTCHAQGYTPLVLHHLLDDMMNGIQGQIDYAEMTLTGDSAVLPLPIGAFAGWRARELVP